MRADPIFDELLHAGVEAGPPFHPSMLDGLPPLARRYLRHAIAPGRALASVAHLSMHGEIKLDGYCPFEAEQVIRYQRGFVWRARVKLHGLPVSGSDRWVDGQGAMRWKLLGLVPIVRGAGPDISRSALGRVQAETVWLPSIFIAPDVRWRQHGTSHLGIDLTTCGEPGHLDITVDAAGALHNLVMQRWGNPEGGAFHRARFGGRVLAERTFDGYTIPSELRVGWYPGSEGFQGDGEFFRVVIDHAAFH